MFEEKIQYDEGKDKAFNKLYEELDMFKNDFVERRMKEVYTDLILLYDNVKSYIVRDDVQAPENEVARKCLEYVLEEVLEVPYRRSIETYFLRIRHFLTPGASVRSTLRTRAVPKRTAKSSECRRTVCQGHKVLRHQMVVVARSSGNGEEGMDD